MKSLYSLFFFLFTCTCLSFSQSITIDDKVYSVDTLANYKIGPSSQYIALRLQNTTRLDVFFVKVGTQNPYITFKSVLGQDSIYTGERPSSMAQRKSAEGGFYFAGTNANFYNTTGYIGYPISTTVVNGEVGTVTASGRGNFALADGKTPYIGFGTYSGTVKSGANIWSINTVNHLRGENQLLLFNQLNGKSTRTNSYGTEVLVKLVDGYSWSSNKTLKAKVLTIEQNKGNMAIPKGYAVLSGHGAAATNLNTLQVGDEIDINLSISLNSGDAFAYTQAVSGDNYSIMLKDGVVETSNFWNELHPRTGIGYTQNRDTVIFCVVDGRGVSVGATTKQLAQLMKSAGAYTAVNLDGGGSSCLYVKEFGVMNTPSDGSERTVANGIFAVSSAPTDNVVTEIEPYTKTVWLPHYGVIAPSFLGYNQYGTLLSKDLKGVVLTCSPETGEILSDGRFLASGANGGIVTATYEGISTTIRVELETSAEVAFRLDSVLIDNQFEYPVEVQSVIGKTTIDVLPQALQWSVANPGICSATNGVLKGLKNGETKVVGTLGDFSDTLVVKVEIPEYNLLVADKFNASEWTLSASTTLNAALSANNLPSNWTHGASVDFTYATTRAPYITLSKSMPLYSLPDSIKVVFNSGDISFNKVIMSLHSNSSSSSVTKEFALTQINSDRALAIASKDWFDVTDISSFPVYFDYIKFLLGSLTSNQTYSLKVKEIDLIYNSATSGIESTTLPNSLFTVFPNPVIDKTIYISSSKDVPGLIAEIFNLSGQKVFRSQTKDLTKEVSYYLSGLSSGIYILKLTSQYGVQTVKLILK